MRQAILMSRGLAVGLGVLLRSQLMGGPPSKPMGSPAQHLKRWVGRGLSWVRREWSPVKCGLPLLLLPPLPRPIVWILSHAPPTYTGSAPAPTSPLLLWPCTDTPLTALHLGVEIYTCSTPASPQHPYGTSPEIPAKPTTQKTTCHHLH
jgi:hypothetical protein